MARRRGYRLLTAAACAAIAGLVAVAAPSPLPVDWPLLDGLIRARAVGRLPAADIDSPVVVIAVDELWVRPLQRSGEIIDESDEPGPPEPEPEPEPV